MQQQHDRLTRRQVLGATGAAAAAVVGASGSAAGAPGCVATSTNANAYDACPAISHVTTVAQGRTGFVMDTCEDDGVTYELVSFDCTDDWWIWRGDLESADDCYC